MTALIKMAVSVLCNVIVFPDNVENVSNVEEMFFEKKNAMQYL